LARYRKDNKSGFRVEDVYNYLIFLEERGVGLSFYLTLIRKTMTYKLGKNLELIKTQTFKGPFMLALTLNLILLGYISYLYQVDPVVRIVQTFIPYDKHSPNDIQLSDSFILAELIKEGSVLPSVALAQAKIESSHYKSTVCKENKNLFGIKYHKCPFVSGQNLNHATYDSYKNNIKCYVHIQNHYLGKIDGHYAESKGYVALIKNFK
jgi:hypothetical protein